MTVFQPVNRQVVVDATAEHAFRTFTDGIDRWWPRQHHIGSAPLKRAIIEPRAGGRWYAISEDDTECDTGKVLVWEPPRRLVLAWQIGADWKYDPSLITEVEVLFTTTGPRQTLVTLEHRNLERFGVAAEDMRKGIDSPNGWQGILDQFRDAAREKTPV